MCLCHDETQAAGPMRKHMVRVLALLIFGGGPIVATAEIRFELAQMMVMKGGAESGDDDFGSRQ